MNSVSTVNNDNNEDIVDEEVHKENIQEDQRVNREKTFHRHQIPLNDKVRCSSRHPKESERIELKIVRSKVKKTFTQHLIEFLVTIG